MIKFLDQNAAWVIMILLLLIVVEITIALLSKGRYVRKRQPQEQGLALEKLSEDGNIVYILFDRKEHTVLFVSHNIEQLLGLRQENVYADLYVLNTLLDKKEQWRLEGVFKEQSTLDNLIQEEVSISPLNQDIQLSMKMTMIPTSDGKYAILSFEDISEEQRVREELKEEIAKVQAIDESKTQFLSKMSHEIRTPMNGMLGMISLAKISQQNQQYTEANEYLDKAEGLTQFLLSIINDILDMSRIESGKLVLEKAEFSIAGLADKLKSMFETTITEKGIAFSVELRDFKIKNVIGDELRISQVLTNFLSNASKFTSKGGHISVVFRQMEMIDGKVTIMFRVKDDGIGMAPEFLSRIFIPFEQEDSGTARRFGGSGLGMAISDNLIKQMGGQILVDSEVGKGTEFTVFLELPVGESTEVTAETMEKTEVVSLEGRRVLMAEDNDINALVAGKLLKHQGLIVERAVNGKEALDTFAGCTPGYYDAILMDIHMPVMDGWEATKQIRKLEHPDAKRIPIIALSADAFVEDKRYSMEIGMNGHVAKPIDYKELQQVLSSCLSE
ncbi:MAG: ATP-binding protein [Lachnospiraceae bacterium]|nr:ATP-binding protein [Lachnospiraceae bacterium]MDD3615750.1 ATP-binding protein [Lachnospiraceae bacterium]